MVKVGRYRLTDTLGIGAFGKVKLGVNDETGEEVAVKLMDKKDILENEFTLQVRREIAIMKALKHRNIVGLKEVLTSRTKIYVVLEFVRGGELYDVLEKSGRMDETTSRRYFQQLVDGVHYCHGRGISHRDLKFENLLLHEDGSLKVTDFGLSAMKGEAQLLFTQCGTLEYCAPEIITSAESGYDGTKVDSWACGIILFALLAGYLPFTADDASSLCRRILRNDFTFPPWFSAEAIGMIKCLLVSDPGRRYSMAEVKQHPWFLQDYVDYNAIEKKKRRSQRKSDRKSKRLSASAEKSHSPDENQPANPSEALTKQGKQLLAKAEFALSHSKLSIPDVAAPPATTEPKPVMPVTAAPLVPNVHSSTYGNGVGSHANGFPASSSAQRATESDGKANTTDAQFVQAESVLPAPLGSTLAASGESEAGKEEQVTPQGEKVERRIAFEETEATADDLAEPTRAESSQDYVVFRRSATHSVSYAEEESARLSGATQGSGLDGRSLETRAEETSAPNDVLDIPLDGIPVSTVTDTDIDKADDVHALGVSSGGPEVGSELVDSAHEPTTEGAEGPEARAAVSESALGASPWTAGSLEEFSGTNGDFLGAEAKAPDAKGHTVASDQVVSDLRSEERMTQDATQSPRDILQTTEVSPPEEPVEEKEKSVVEEKESALGIQTSAKEPRQTDFNGSRSAGLFNPDPKNALSAGDEAAFLAELEEEAYKPMEFDLPEVLEQTVSDGDDSLARATRLPSIVLENYEDAKEPVDERLTTETLTEPLQKDVEVSDKGNPIEVIEEVLEEGEDPELEFVPAPTADKDEPSLIAGRAMQIGSSTKALSLNAKEFKKVANESQSGNSSSQKRKETGTVGAAQESPNWFVKRVTTWFGTNKDERGRVAPDAPRAVNSAGVEEELRFSEDELDDGENDMISVQDAHTSVSRVVHDWEVRSTTGFVVPQTNKEEIAAATAVKELLQVWEEMLAKGRGQEAIVSKEELHQFQKLLSLWESRKSVPTTAQTTVEDTSTETISNVERAAEPSSMPAGRGEVEEQSNIETINTAGSEIATTEVDNAQQHVEEEVVPLEDTARFGKESERSERVGSRTSDPPREVGPQRHMQQFDSLSAFVPDDAGDGVDADKINSLWSKGLHLEDRDGMNQQPNAKVSEEADFEESLEPKSVADAEQQKVSDNLTEDPAGGAMAVPSKEEEDGDPGPSPNAVASAEPLSNEMESFLTAEGATPDAARVDVDTAAIVDDSGTKEESPVAEGGLSPPQGSPTGTLGESRSLSSSGRLSATSGEHPRRSLVLRSGRLSSAKVVKEEQSEIKDTLGRIFRKKRPDERTTQFNSPLTLRDTVNVVGKILVDMQADVFMKKNRRKLKAAVPLRKLDTDSTEPSRLSADVFLDPLAEDTTVVWFARSRNDKTPARDFLSIYNDLHLRFLKATATSEVGDSESHSSTTVARE